MLIHLLIQQLVIKHLLVPGIMLDAGNTKVKKHPLTALMELMTPKRQVDIHQVMVWSLFWRFSFIRAVREGFPEEVAFDLGLKDN